MTLVKIITIIISIIMITMNNNTSWLLVILARMPQVPASCASTCAHKCQSATDQPLIKDILVSASRCEKATVIPDQMSFCHFFWIFASLVFTGALWSTTLGWPKCYHHVVNHHFGWQHGHSWLDMGTPMDNCDRKWLFCRMKPHCKALYSVVRTILPFWSNLLDLKILNISFGLRLQHDLV